jgi:hypothetical protein
MVQLKDTELSRFGRFARALRDKNGEKSARIMAEKLGTSRTQLELCEIGAIVTPLWYIRAFNKAYDLTLDERVELREAIISKGRQRIELVRLNDEHKRMILDFVCDMYLEEEVADE